MVVYPGDDVARCAQGGWTALHSRSGCRRGGSVAVRKAICGVRMEAGLGEARGKGGCEEASFETPTHSRFGRTMPVRLTPTSATSVSCRWRHSPRYKFV